MEPWVADVELVKISRLTIYDPKFSCDEQGTYSAARSKLSLTGEMIDWLTLMAVGHIHLDQLPYKIVSHQ
jgi:hypothetical protein